MSATVTEDGWKNPELVAPAFAFLGVAVTAFMVWLSKRLLGKAAYETALHTGYSDFVKTLRAERAQLMELINVEREAAALARNELRGEVNNLKQIIGGLKRIMRKAGLSVPDDHELRGEIIQLGQGPVDQEEN